MYGSASAAPAPSPPPDGASAPARDDPTAETLAASAPPRDVVASLVRSGAAPGRGGTSPPAHLAASPASHPRRDPVSPAALAALDAAAGVVSAAAESHRAASSSSSSSRLSHGASARHHRREPPHPSSPPRAFADAMWASAEDAVDAVARAVAADGAGEDPDPRARELVARAAAAHALHAAEVARFAAAGAASAARDARRANASALDPGADADAERAAALADQAAEAATRAAARVKTLHNVRGVPAEDRGSEDVSRVVKSLEVRDVGDDVERLRGAASRAAAFDAFDASRAARRLAKHAEVLRRGEAAAFDPASGGALPPTPEAVRRRALARSPRVDAVAAARDARARGEALRLAAEANETRPTAEYSPIPRSPATTTPLGAPRRVPMTPEDARAYDEAEARVRRREAAAREAEEAVARALEAAGARGARGQRGNNAEGGSAAAAARGGRLVVPPPPNTAAAIAARARASLEWSSSRPEGAGGARPDPPSAQTSPATLEGASRGGRKTLPARDEKRVDAGDDESNRKRRGPFATKKKDRVASRRDPLSFSTPFISNAHTRFHGEISAADKRLFFSEGKKGSEDEDEEGFRDAPGSDSDSPRRKPDDAPSSRDWIARGLPRPTKKSEASAAEARRRAAETARRRAAARAEKSGAGFGGEKTKKGAASLGRNRVPRVEEKDEKEGFARSPDHPVPIRDGTSSGGASEADASSRRGYRYPSRAYPPSYAEARLDAARSLLADLDTGAPLTPEDASLLELERRSSGAIARVRAYRSAVESPPGVRRGRGEAVPAHERYEHYKMRGFGGMGAKTSWAK